MAVIGVESILFILKIPDIQILWRFLKIRSGYSTKEGKSDIRMEWILKWSI